jgi:cytochrome c553
MMPRVLRFEASLALALAVALGTGLAVAGEPATPLGKWMKPNVGTPLAGQDFGTLQKSLDLVATKPPSGDYPRWAEYAKAGAAAAAKGDVKAIKATCKQCHDDYKDKYKKEFPNKVFP